MIQDERWLVKWQEAVGFLETNRRKHSKFMPEELNMRSQWVSFGYWQIITTIAIRKKSLRKIRNMENPFKFGTIVV